MPKKNTEQIDRIIVILALATIFVAAITVPIDKDYNDIYIKTTIEKPITGSVNFVDIKATAQPHTFLSVPALGSLISSGNVMIQADTPSKEVRANAGTIYRLGVKETNIVLKKVPVDETTITLTLYENRNLVQTEIVEIS